MKYNFKKETETAKLPTRHTFYAAGVDFYSDEGVLIEPRKSAIISTGISWNPEPFIVGTKPRYTVALLIQSRSGLAFKKGIEASNAGVIDSDYNSTKDKKAIIHVKLYNNSDIYFRVEQGDKICQGVPQLIPIFTDVKTLDHSRGSCGFGSSDEKEK